MEALKKGSSGEGVKILQKTLGITADGVFGNGTENAVKTYQSKNDLVADGVAGEKTLVKLGILESVSKASFPFIVYSPLKVHVTRLPNREIEYIVIHFTGGSNSAKGKARACKGTFEVRSASADFVVDDEEVVQYNPDMKNYYCWAVGGKSYGNHGGKYYGKATNRNCVSIEICSTCTPSTSQAVSVPNHKGWSFTDDVLNRALILTRMLMKKYDIDKDHVIRHYDVTGKLCPALAGWNDEYIYSLDGKVTGERNNSARWQEFRNSL